MPTKSEAKDLLGMFVVLVVAFSIYMIIQEDDTMTRPIRLPQIPQAEKDRRAAARKEEMAVWERMQDKARERMNKRNGIGVKKR